MLNVSLFPDRGYGCVESGRVRLKKNETVWLSRKDPYEDGHAHALKIDRVHRGFIYFRTDSRYPEDAAEGVWRLDVGVNEVQLDSQLHCIKNRAECRQSPALDYCEEHCFWRRCHVSASSDQCTRRRFASSASLCVTE